MVGGGGGNDPEEAYIIINVYFERSAQMSQADLNLGLDTVKHLLLSALSRFRSSMKMTYFGGHKLPWLQIVKKI